MSDQGEKTCPLCAEEMDLTDQQLKPCKCGYEICIWCWHHIMDMAEKDETEGRCPACRTPYNKEKIVGMAANCERLVAEMNMERKTKSHKAKSKMSEGRKQLSSVRVIQRNLVYIVGLPLNLADEDLLQQKEYFGQYGKVLKVSISRTAAGSIQHFANNTCSVYITYSKEEEAVRCIQSVHGFVLEGRSLRACFGTTKYCHAWLRNVPCSNPDCLYLHEVGSQEDSFSKDEIISAYTRSRVQQITGTTTNLQRRSGNVLPPPSDEYYTNICPSPGKQTSKSSSNNPASTVRGSPPNSSSGRSVALPAAASWAARASNSQPSSASLVCTSLPSKQKHETHSVSVAFSAAVTGTTQVPLLHDEVGNKLIEEGQKVLHKGKEEPPEPVLWHAGTEHQITASEAPAAPSLPATSTVDGQLHCPPSLEDKDKCKHISPNTTNSAELYRSGQPYGPGGMDVPAKGNIHNLCSDVASMKIDKHLGDENIGDTCAYSSLSDNTLANSSQIQGLQLSYHEKFREPSHEQSNWRLDSVTKEQSDWKSDSRTQVENRNLQIVLPEVEEDLQKFVDQRLKDPEAVTRPSYLPNSSPSFHLSSHTRAYSPQLNEPYGSTTNYQILDKKVEKGLLQRPSGVPKVPNGYHGDVISTADSERAVDHFYLLPDEVKKQELRRFLNESTSASQNGATDLGENNIISNILSMDFGSWDESLNSPRNLAKLLGEPDRRQGSLKLSNSWKTQSNNQSRFSFARQEGFEDQVSDAEPSLNNIVQVPFDHPLSHHPDFNYDKHGACNGSSTFNIEESDNSASSRPNISFSKLSGPRVQISAPPGFSLPSRPPPPGFTSHERTEPTSDAISGNHFLGAPTLLRNPYQGPPTGNIASGGDIEFMDPAILAVGKGRLPPNGLSNANGVDMRSGFPLQSNVFENEARLTQRSLPPLQNQRFADTGDGFSLPSDTYRIPSRIMDQTLASNLSPLSQLSLQQARTPLMSNGQWSGWNEVQQGGSNLGMAELLRTEILGLNKLYTGYEDSKFWSAQFR
ncbi:uncharacterized protein LOC127797221 [Diospyros lotus]|uniref:uncharacterized protein LOC127797221 n=1 Tax=Diospyros lotus TaxID=55363 RepID=UPI002255518C|nr:uncharacterized protein LOC127797221 [Diospyros lotus]